MGEMIRFKADTWIEALFRFFAMAAPDGNVYVEIAAPDLRFAAVLVLGLALLIARKRLTAPPRVTLALLATILLATIAWLRTTGNGRYFMPMLLFVGPLLVGMIYLLPLTRSFRLFLAGGMLAIQAFVVVQSSPWDAWAWVQWRDAPYFQVDVPPIEPTAPPVTYVTLSSISYSLIAPQFPATSRWINITSVQEESRDGKWAQDFLKEARGAVMLLAPSIRDQAEADGLPGEKVKLALNLLLAPQRLALNSALPCTLLRSAGLAAIGGKRDSTAAERVPAGFWMCSLNFPVGEGGAKTQAVPITTEAVFARVEQACPRFFSPGTAKSMRINGGALRAYGGSDMKVYVLDDGQVLYKFWRALNPVVVGSVEGILSGAKTIQCENIRGRSGLPWEREI